MHAACSSGWIEHVRTFEPVPLSAVSLSFTNGGIDICVVLVCDPGSVSDMFVAWAEFPNPATLQVNG